MYEGFVATYFPLVSIGDQDIFQQLFLDALDGLVKRKERLLFCNPNKK
jgi:hypothetical protein